MTTTSQLATPIRRPRVGQMTLAAAAISTALVITPVMTPWSGAPTKPTNHSPRTSFAEFTSIVPNGAMPKPDPVAKASTALRVGELRTLSNLTADQIGRLFGVSRRSVQNWISGAPMASGHEERLAQLTTLILNSGSSPEERRLKLLNSNNGESLFHQLVRDRERGALVYPVAVSARHQLDA